MDSFQLDLAYEIDINTGDIVKDDLPTKSSKNAASDTSDVRFAYLQERNKTADAKCLDDDDTVTTVLPEDKEDNSSTSTDEHLKVSASSSDDDHQTLFTSSAVFPNEEGVEEEGCVVQDRDLVTSPFTQANRFVTSQEVMGT